MVVLLPNPVSKRANGVAIAVVSNHLVGTRAVELGAVVKHTSYHMIYVIYQNIVSPYRNAHQDHTTFQQHWFDLVNQCLFQKISHDSAFDRMVLQPFRVPLPDLQVPQPAMS
jgi:hypothetical protein